MTKPKLKSHKNRKSLRWLGLMLITIALVVGFRLPAAAAEARHYTELEFPPLSDVQIPDYTRYELDNGMVVYLMEDHELPLVSGTMLIRTGDRLEPANEVGLAAITGDVMRTGGTTEHPADELNQLLEQRAASVETGISSTAGSASFSTLAEDVDLVFDLFAEVLRKPAFPQEKMDLAKKQQAGQIARRNDDPNDIASREFAKLIYGEKSPYARTVEYETLDNISREDLVAFYEKYFHPDDMILGIVGDFDSAKMRQRIQEEFGDWEPASEPPQPTVPQASQAKEGGIFMVNQPQLTQSYVQLGHLGGQFDNPDYPALDVLNQVLNGFGGRLFNEVRSRQGLAYSVYGFWSPRFDYPGVFLAGGQTRSEGTVPFIQAIRSEIEKLRTTPITPQELSSAKDQVLNSFVFNFQDPSQTLSRLMRYEYYGYPEDFLFRYQEGVKSTTIEDVQRVAQKYLQPDKLVTLVVGSADTIQPPLTSLSSDVTSLDIAIPEPKSS
ncbi:MULTISPECIES: M16 family metallopeptidase [unclassified Coleofasciculus]|uniref:M16 family metallopeptidase n=2 Tax=unclassified Coleofasciculus TaxID=2692782 RepID=UPI00187F317A|nr:insulinase family protein [Coleofasciculus sp. LEGE 07081]MBE9147181.1 insulinase family protein [Coleofasciculus sp. LEGE 07092]